MLCGKSKFMTQFTPLKSIPLAMTSVAIKTQMRPARNASTIKSLCCTIVIIICFCFFPSVFCSNFERDYCKTGWNHFWTWEKSSTMIYFILFYFCIKENQTIVEEAKKEKEVLLPVVLTALKQSFSAPGLQLNYNIIYLLN